MVKDVSKSLLLYFTASQLHRGLAHTFSNDRHCGNLLRRARLIQYITTSELQESKVALLVSFLQERLIGEQRTPNGLR